jgi:hypothetical protein
VNQTKKDIYILMGTLVLVMAWVIVASFLEVTQSNQITREWVQYIFAGCFLLLMSSRIWFDMRDSKLLHKQLKLVLWVASILLFVWGEANGRMVFDYLAAVIIALLFVAPVRRDYPRGNANRPSKTFT